PRMPESGVRTSWLTVASSLGMTHLIAETRLTKEQQNYLASIRQSGHALTQLVEDLLDFSTIEVGRFALHPRSESLRKLLESVVEML
ncbi:sensor histidine kinase, partial [Rhizobium johnstonii]|uniref:sensor histidine kinase n=1 Tax=Rhizobium johnstonii TaxID=3019933 RepID=UPI003F950EF7